MPDKRPKKHNACPHLYKEYLSQREICTMLVLGQGAEGVTYLGFDTQEEQFVVLKERMWKPLAQDTRQKRLEREARFYASLTTPTSLIS